MRVFTLTLVALVAFAGNSVLCRLALASNFISPELFTAIRLGSGALFLVVLLAAKGSPSAFRESGSWRGAAFLVLYALPFSIAYVSLTTATGAILLFGAVQLTMVGAGLTRGERISPLGWLAFAGAIGGVVYLLLPGLEAPNPIGAVLMIMAGVGWGFYSIAGKSKGDAITATAANFGRAAIVVVPLTALYTLVASTTSSGTIVVSPRGAALATASGVVASAAGYAIWYVALKSLSATRAALVQLAVPVLAAALGFVLLNEALTQRTIVGSTAILASIALGIVSRGRR